MRFTALTEACSLLLTVTKHRSFIGFNHWKSSCLTYKSVHSMWVTETTQVKTRETIVSSTMIGNRFITSSFGYLHLVWKKKKKPRGILNWLLAKKKKEWKKEKKRKEKSIHRLPFPFCSPVKVYLFLHCSTVCGDCLGLSLSFDFSKKKKKKQGTVRLKEWPSVH